MNWTLKFLPEVKRDLEKLAGNQRILVAKAIEKVRQNPVSIFDGGYGKPLGNKGGHDWHYRHKCPPVHRPHLRC